MHSFLQLCYTCIALCTLPSIPVIADCAQLTFTVFVQLKVLALFCAEAAPPGME